MAADVSYSYDQLKTQHENTMHNSTSYNATTYELIKKGIINYLLLGPSYIIASYSVR